MARRTRLLFDNYRWFVASVEKATVHGLGPCVARAGEHAFPGSGPQLPGLPALRCRAAGAGLPTPPLSTKGAVMALISASIRVTTKRSAVWRECAGCHEVAPLARHETHCPTCRIPKPQRRSAA